MASSYWMKFYYDMLDDPKMGRLSDHLWRRVSEFFLIAGESGNGGYLPSVEDMSWRLRTTPEEITDCLETIERVGIVANTPEGWFVINFAKRQDAASNAERQRLYREKLRKSNGHSNEPVTTRYTDIDKDIDIDTDENVDSDHDDDIPETSYKPLEVAFCKATGKHPRIGGGQPTHKWVAAFLEMQKMGATPEDVNQAVLEMVDKNYTIAAPSSIVTWVSNSITKRTVKAKSDPDDPENRRKYFEGPYADFINH